MRTLLLSVLFFLPLVATNAQRALKPVKAALKENNYKEAVNKISALRKDSLYRDNPKLCLYSIEANKGLNDAENTKLYLKKDYDTLAFFSTTHQIIKEAVKLDSLERALQKSDGQKPKETNYICSLLQQYMPNTAAASRHFYKKGKYGEAMSYLRTCLDLPHTSIGKLAKLSDKAENSNAALYLLSAYQTKNLPETHRYEELALGDSMLRKNVLKCLAYTAEAEHDTTTYRKWLDKGFQEFSDEPLFFTLLADYHTARGDNHAVLCLSEKQLVRDSSDVSALVAQCMAQLHLQRYDDCISSANRLLRADSTAIEANYFLGASYTAKANDIQLPENAFSRNYKKIKKEQTSLYRQAMPYLERYRAQAPKQAKRWGPLLYKVYLALNEGKKFSEIEKLLNY